MPHQLKCSPHACSVDPVQWTKLNLLQPVIEKLAIVSWVWWALRGSLGFILEDVACLWFSALFPPPASLKLLKTILSWIWGEKNPTNQQIINLVCFLSYLALNLGFLSHMWQI